MSVATEFKQRLEAFLANPQEFVKTLSPEQQEKLCASFATECSAIFHKQFFKEYKDNSPPFMSNVGKCARMLAFKLHGFKGEAVSAKARMTFFFGDLIEAAIGIIAEASGWELANKQESVEVAGLRGRTDGRPAKNAVVDIKSMSAASFEITKRSGGVGDDFGYLTQISLYRAGLQVDEAFFLCVNKNTGEIAVWEAPNAPDLVELAKAKYNLVMASTPDRLPARPYQPVNDKKTGKLCLPMQCKFCDFRLLCWNVVDIAEGYNKSEVYVVDSENPTRDVDPSLARPPVDSPVIDS
jgi:hypothetical protein